MKINKLQVTRLPVGLVFAILITIARVSHAQPLQRGELLYERQQYAAAMPLLKQSAKSGNAQAQSLLGVMYREGQGVPADDRTAAHWFQQAAAQGERAAQYQLGMMYEDGKGGLPRDDRRAIDLYIRSSQQGFAPAQLMLGTDYELGDGLPRSRAQAIALLRQAGEEGSLMVNALTATGAPARFDSARALGNYLLRRGDSQFDIQWSDAANHYSGAPLTLGDILRSKSRAGRAD